MFTVPDSSPPSTPDKSQYINFADLSTTPAGPPPSSAFTAASFTPRGPPPSSVFGSSQLRPGQTSANALFGTHLNTRTKNGTPARAIAGSSAFVVPDSSPFQEAENDDEDADDEVAYDQRLDRSASRPGETPRGLKRSNRGEPIISSGERVTAREESTISGIARSIISRAKAPSLYEPDDLILKTDSIVGRIHQQASSDDGNGNRELSKLVKDLTFLWRSLLNTESVPGGIGPKEKASALTKANYLSSLLLQIHHPPPHITQDLSVSRLGRSSRLRESGAYEHPGAPRQTSIPKALLEWLNKYHIPFPNDLEEVSTFEPTSTAHEQFWDIVFSSVLRGRIVQVVQLLKEADFGSAESAIDDGYNEPGYHGDQLIIVGIVIDNAVKLLESCPAVSGDWDVKGKDWALFRHRVHQEMANLKSFAEGDRHDWDDDGMNFRASVRGEKSLSLSAASRKVQSKVPATIRENLEMLYAQLLGSVDQITMAAQDWLEASILITVWWDGEDELTGGSLSESRHSINRPRTREVDLRPLHAYKDRLYAAYTDVTNTEDEDARLRVDTLSPMQVGVACIFEDNLECVVDLISVHSMTLASALVEVGGLAGWLSQEQSASNDVMDEFDQSDLMVLSYVDNQRPSKWKATDILIQYAELLSQKPNIWSSDERLQREGWELAVQILSRMQDRQTANTKLRALLDSLPLDTSERVDKLLNLCNRLGLEEAARNISQRYAERLQETSSDYGSALLYYARAHNSAKIKEVLNLLIAYSLVLSSAYPPASDLDERLRHFLSSPRDSLAALGHIDGEAARLLSLYLSGYATLRVFYDLRDVDVNLSQGQTPEHRPLARKRAAANALITVIDSASDTVRGGLFDPDADAVVPVDALLALLGEALPLLNRKPTFPPLHLPPCFKNK